MTAAPVLDYFERTVRERLFAPGSVSSRRIGLEVELLPMRADTGLPCPLGVRDGGRGTTLGVVRQHGVSAGWREQRSSKGAPYFALPNGATVTFEPGGQVELCTPPHASIATLLAEVRATLAGLRR